MSELPERARALGPQIVAARAEMDAIRRLPDGLAAAFRDAELYRLCIPRVHGGLEGDPRTLVETIEALGEMFLAQIVTPDGVIDGTLSQRSPRIVPDGRTFSYKLWDRGVDIRVTQTDVRAIQLAKGALYAGARLLMEKLGVDKLDRIKLAGAFGTHIDPKYALIIGLVPDCAVDRVTAVGNAAGTGARMALLNRGHRREVEALVRRIDKIETALEPRFQEHFVNAMAFPNRVEAFPELAKVVTLPVRPAGHGTGPPRRRRKDGNTSV